MKQHLINLKNSLQYRYIYVVIWLILFILILNNTTYIIILPFYLFYFIKKHKDILIVPALLLVVYFFVSNIIINANIEESDYYTIKVTSIIKEEKQFTGSIKGKKVQVRLSEYKKELLPGDIIKVTGELSQPINNTLPNQFNYKNYLLSKKITKQLYVYDYEVIDHQFHLSILTHKVNEYIKENFVYSKEYIKTFILADKSDFDDDFIKNINLLGISHLFAVSGLHIGLLLLVIENIYKRISSKDKVYTITIPILISYVILTSFSPSIVRAFLMYITYLFRKYKIIVISSIDSLSIIFILLLLTNPFYYYNVGFQLSFLVTLTILLVPHLLKNKPIIETVLMITMVAFLCSLPIVLRLNGQVNLYTLIINIVLILYMTYIILPLGYLAFLFSKLDYLYYLILKPFNYIIYIASQVNFLTVKVAINSTIEIMILYIFIYFIIVNLDKKAQVIRISIFFMLMLIIISNKAKFNPVKSISMIDIYGDSILIIDSFDNCNILIDTGETDDNDKVIKYIQSKGIKRLDYVIITHDHNDHRGELNDIKKEFNIIHLIDEPSDHRVLCGSFDMNFYNTSITSSNTNNQSIVFSLQVEDKLYLFTGDMESINEEIFIKKYLVDIDYLKSPHHGSNTSSSDEFLEHIKPESVLISSYRYNTHGHPNEDVIKRYKEHDIKIHRTDKLGTIEIKYFIGYEIKKFHKP